MNLYVKTAVSLILSYTETHPAEDQYTHCLGHSGNAVLNTLLKWQTILSAHRIPNDHQYHAKLPAQDGENNMFSLFDTLSFLSKGLSPRVSGYDNQRINRRCPLFNCEFVSNALAVILQHTTETNSVTVIVRRLHAIQRHPRTHSPKQLRYSRFQRNAPNCGRKLNLSTEWLLSRLILDEGITSGDVMKSLTNGFQFAHRS